MTAQLESITPHPDARPARGAQRPGLAVACRAVTKEFGQGQARVLALRGVDLEAYAGEMTLLVGPSGCGKTTLISIIAGLLDAVGIGNKARALPSQLSGGQQQRVAIARALIHEPRLLVCDEPTAALDAQAGQTVMELLRRVAVQPGRAVIVVTHDSRVFGFGDRIVHMSDGHIEKVEVPAGREAPAAPAGPITAAEFVPSI